MQRINVVKPAISVTLVTAGYYSWGYRCFFSSRRRHTRYWRDWSSDVCSSDLSAEVSQGAGRIERLRAEVSGQRVRELNQAQQLSGRMQGDVELPLPTLPREPGSRSEERRVGKERRSRWSPYH